MSAAAPTFSLPPCPVCSTIMSLERPFWRFAHNTSRARKVNCYAFSGCAHSDEVCDPKKLYDVPEEWSLVEDAWAARVEVLFAARTERWTDAAIAGFRRALNDRAFLPGSTEPLNLSPAHPAQQEPNERHEDGNQD